MVVVLCCLVSLFRPLYLDEADVWSGSRIPAVVVVVVIVWCCLVVSFMSSTLEEVCGRSGSLDLGGAGSLSGPVTRGSFSCDVGGRPVSRAAWLPRLPGRPLAGVRATGSVVGLRK